MTGRFTLRYFAAILTICAACPVSIPAQDKSANDIHLVDFRNFSYRPVCLNWGEVHETVKVKDGSFSRKDPNDPVTFVVTDVVYGDLNGDGMDEAVVLATCNSGGSGWFDEAFIYVMKSSKPVMVLRVLGGDRAAGGIRAVRIEGGLLLIERLGSIQGSAVGAEFIDTTSYRLSGRKLLQVGRSVRRTLRGERKAKRIQFERGETSAVLTGATGSADFYALRAVGNHTMTVRITSKEQNARFELVVDDFTMAYRKTEWSGKIEGHADYYIIVVSNSGSADYRLEVTVR